MPLSYRKLFREYFQSKDEVNMKQYYNLSSRCDADVVINNIFKVFDSEHTGKVVAQELLMAFSMSMKGTGNEEYHLISNH